MKKHIVFCLLLSAVVLKADTVEIRQPGLVESVGLAAWGTLRCVWNFTTGLVAGSSTVVQTPNGTANTVVAAPTIAIPPAVTVAPTVPLMPYGAYYGGYYGCRHYYGGYGYPHYRPYHRCCYGPYRHGYCCGASRDLCNAAAITGIVANSLQAVSAVTCPVALANPVAPVVVSQPSAVAVTPTATVAAVHTPAGVATATPVGAMPVGASVLPATSIANPVATPVATANAVVTPSTPAKVNVTPVTAAPATVMPATTVIAPQATYVSAPAPAVAPAVVAPYGKAGRVVYFGF